MGKKKDDIEFEIQEAVVEEKADTTLKDEAEEMKEQARKTIQKIKEQARNPRSRSAKLRIAERGGK